MHTHYLYREGVHLFRTADRALRFAPLLLMLVIAVVLAPLVYAVNCDFACQQAMSTPNPQCSYIMSTPNAIVPGVQGASAASLLSVPAVTPPVIAAPVAVAYLQNSFAPESPPISPLGAVLRV